ncbi:GNAT family N-acetyltransferase [Glycomyces terrestris]|uniref:GNAT family N-acetyltransferase n=1 Tax=Glycomyces terrestris TaxID=2493553 RepID=A0A426UXS2_9ACTN|nr:GNAT family N-acetyltransferase [Glycomyces terrestris]RRR99366.1 GNAT family N-acetyltransferase [Glycomyces terrestris]
MTEIRFAGPGDIDEIVRLRGIMLSQWMDTADNGWHADTAAVIARRLAEPEPSMVIPAVDAPDGSGALAACAVGLVDERLPSPRNRSGRFGLVINVVTDPRWRRRGFGRACMDALMDWYEARDVRILELTATEAGEGLYRSFGFERLGDAVMMRRTSF